MNDYQQYTAEEFLQDAWFLAWVKHGQPEARQFWEQWQREHPHQRETLLLAKDMAEALKNRPHNLSPDQERLEIEQIVKLTRHVPERSPWAGFTYSLNQHRWLAAATLVILLGIGWGLFQRSNSSERVTRNPLSELEKTGNDRWTNQVNGTSQPVHLTLPDGSRITLMPHSQASYPRTFEADERRVYLKGDAVFSVVHEGQRPFLVYSGNLVTRVLGTRFRVQARPGENQTLVSVISGKVSVMEQKDWVASRKPEQNRVGGVVLTANQQVTYDANDNRYRKELVEKPVVIASATAKPETFDFEDTPATNVFERLKKAYGVEIIYDTSALRHCTLTASLAGVTLYDQLQLLCASIGATYEVVDTRIIISSKGCS
ncbi:FecR family protein [Larkinella bovis]|uniref:FecR family protein n=1 Tax=Larkinella bovis TaxID=683041 RepID=A0ABW0IHM9_9BACT